MTDTSLLNAAIAKIGITKKELVKALGLTYAGFWKKLNNQSEFKATEIKTTRFGPEVGGGGGVNKSPEEAFCLCKETATEQLEGKKQRYHDQRLLLKRVEQGLRRLPGDYERILRWKAGFEHHRLTWNQIGNRLNEDSSYCRRRYDEGIDILTGIVYGAAAFPIQGVLDMDTSLEQEKILATDFDKNRQE